MLDRLLNAARSRGVRIGRTFLAAKHENIDSLRKLKGMLSRLPCPEPPKDIPGWMTIDEHRALYSLARFCSGSVLEIGPWLGLSTVTLARGVLDSGMSRRFVTCELDPSLDNFRPHGGKIGFFYPSNSVEPMGTCSIELFERDIKPVLQHPGGVIGQLRSNLRRESVESVVSIFAGDFRNLPPESYGLLFADTMHDPAEISRNASHLRRYIASRGILACHDSSEVNERCLRRFIDFEETFTVDSLFVGRVK